MATLLLGGIWLVITVTVYALCRTAHTRLGKPPWLPPVIPTMLLLMACLWLSGFPYASYFQAAGLLHFLLGPATVAIAVPLYAATARLKLVLWPGLGALVVGCGLGVGSAVGLAWLLGLSETSILSLAPRSVTTPIAIAIAERIGGVASLTAVVVIVSGVIGAVAAPVLLRLVGVSDPRVQGFAIGIAAHGLGTAQAFELSPEAGAFAGLAMGLNGGLTALLLALAVPGASV